jgi:hypothetical protein
MFLILGIFIEIYSRSEIPVIWKNHLNSKFNASFGVFIFYH